MFLGLTSVIAIMDGGDLACLILLRSSGSLSCRVSAFVYHMEKAVLDL